MYGWEAWTYDAKFKVFEIGNTVLRKLYKIRLSKETKRELRWERSKSFQCSNGYTGGRWVLMLLQNLVAWG